MGESRGTGADGGILQIELPGSGDGSTGMRDGEARGMAVRPKNLQPWSLGWGRPGRKQGCERKPRARSWPCKFEMPGGLNEQLDASI